MKKTMVFDLGGVLIDWNPRHLYRRIFTDEREMEYFLTEICSPAWNASTDIGKPFAEAVQQLLPLYPQYREQIQAYHSRWEEMIRGHIPGTLKLLEELKATDYPLAALSNWSSETFHVARSRFEFLDWFDPLIISGDVGCTKPDRRIFEILLEGLQRDAGDCVYIDDSLENIQTASGMGFVTIHFSTPEQLRQELGSSGLIQ
jgi:2-haloacid dehalogenase